MLPLGRLIPRLLAVLALGIALALPTAASASKVAITEVTGPVQDDVAAGLESALRRAPDIELISFQDWLNAADSARLDPITDRERLARRLRVDRMVRARVARAAGKWSLRVEVLDKNGRRLKRWRAKTSKVSRLEGLIRKKMMSRLGPALGTASTAKRGRSTRSATAARAPGPSLDGPVRLGILEVKGGQRSTRRLARALKADPQIKPVSTRKVRATAAKLKVNLDTAEGRVRVARALRLRAWLAMRSRGRRSRYAATGKVYSGHDGQLVDRVEGRGDSESKAIRGMLSLLVAPLNETRAATRSAVASTSSRLRRQPAPVPRSAARQRTPVAATFNDTSSATSRVQGDFPDQTDGGGNRSRSPLMVAIGVGLQTRDFSYTDDAFQTLRPYELGGAPALSGDLRWYPAGHFTGGFLRHLGVDGRLRYLVGVQSEDSDGNAFDTSSFDAFGGLRGRVPLGSHELGIGVGVGHHNFDIEVPEDGPALPGVGYTYLRFGADSRFALPASLHLYVGAAWRQVLSSGDLGSDEWFPNATQGGIDANLQLGWAFLGGLELRLGAEYTRYFFSLNPELGDTFVAGGALDQYISGTFDVVWSLDG